MLPSAAPLGEWWEPTQCTLQLQFGQPPTSDGKPFCGALAPGMSYQGISQIVYRKMKINWSSLKDTGKEPRRLPPPLFVEQHRDAFLAEAEKDAALCASRGLHLHALTAVPPTAHPTTMPLSIQRYKLTFQSGFSGKKALRRGEALKITSIEDSNSTDEGETSSRHEKQGKKGKRNGKAGGKPHGKVKDKPPVADECTTAPSDPGSLMVYFEEEPELAAGAEVLLLVQFTAFIQEPAAGGVFVPVRPHATGAALCTHFEPKSARLAFPCPDHCAYRLLWKLQSLQLPEHYVSLSPASAVQMCFNSPCVRQRHSPVQKVAVLEFALCGPLPAYLLAFAAFTEPLHSLCVKVKTRSLHHAESGGGGEEDAPLALRVLSAVPCDMAFILRIVREGIETAETYFQSPLPLLAPFEEGGEDSFPRRGVTVLVGPVYPHISGMESHGLILLREGYFTTGPGTDCSEWLASNRVHLERATLIVHEILHWWLGNALGLPFGLKEGLCLFLQDRLAPPLVGCPAAALHARESNTKEQCEPEEGKHLTCGSYRRYAAWMEAVVVEHGGLKPLQRALQRLVAKHLTQAMKQAEEEGRYLFVELDGRTGSLYPSAPFITAKDVLHALADEIDGGSH